ncbi:carbohydrate ABC transporter permease [Cohnella sp. JJ-181]|uniref:carbohydrate ABC transporter permease n=1 Tax=Cohnella rhizoplanae TaxID=2974897 RepID=UPI0022FF68E6|nr:carbohydrate ABC transporter permease [Cohnella sp. JJ-181]CAI6078248.1 L-arabinose transport system permease protein AraQ [Cohnella sp. JJ-181]
MNRTRGDYAFNSLNYVVLTLLGFATVFPFLNLLAISLNDTLDTMRGGIYFFPRKWTLLNYEIIFRENGLLMAGVRSVIRTVLGTALGLFCTTLLAYALSRREFFLRKQLNVVLVLTMYINGGLIPTYLLIRNLHLMNNFAVYILPLLISVYNVIIMRSYFEQLPDGITESAKIDGATDFQVLFRIVLQISLPVLSTIALFIAVMHWNSWFDNYLYASRNQNLSLLQYTLQKVLIQSANEIVSDNGHANVQAIRNNPESIRAAITMVVTLPILFVYPFLQKYFVKGITIGAMKE